MDYVNGVRAIIIDRSTEGQSKNNSTILLLQSEERWGSMDIRRLKDQLTPNQQLIILPDSTNVVPIRMGEVVVQEKPMNDSPRVEKCDSSCKFWSKPWSYDKCRSCKRNLIIHYEGITDNWEAK